MSNNVLSHPAFERDAVVNRPHRGTYPKGVACLSRLRNRKYLERDDDRPALRKWADEHGERPASGIYDFDAIREKKAISDVRERAEASPYGEELRDIEAMKQDLIRVFSAMRMREQRILTQAAREFIDTIPNAKYISGAWPF